MPRTINNATLPIAGTQLGVQTFGNLNPASVSQTPVLIFLHEALGSIPQWKDFPKRLSLSVDLPAIVYERQGFGSSAKQTTSYTKGYLEYEAFEVLPQVIEYFGLSQVILIGHSDGGSIALLYAARFPEKVTGVITEAAHVLVELQTLEGIRNVVDIYEEKLKPRLWRYHGDKTDQVFKNWHETWLSPDFRSWNIENHLSDITSDALIIQGANDPYGSIQQVDTITNQTKGMTKVWWIPDCGHNPHQQYPDLVIEKISNFINNLKN